MINKKGFVLLALLFLASCVGVSRQSQFYSLQPEIGGAGEKACSQKLSINIDKISVPEYLDRPQIVTGKRGDVEVQVSEFNRWSEDLTSMLPRVFADDLALYLPEASVRFEEFSSSSFDRTIEAEIVAMDGVPGKTAVFDVWWTLRDASGRILVQKRWGIELPAGEGYDGLVRAYSLAVQRWAGAAAKIICQN